MSSQNYKDKLDQFINENNEIKFATLEGENTHERIANHFNTLRELLQLTGLQEILEIGNTTEAGTTLRAIGGIQIENFLKVSSNIGTANPEDPIDYILARQPDGMIVMKLIDEILGNIIEKLPPDDPEAEFLLRADGTRVEPLKQPATPFIFTPTDDFTLSEIKTALEADGWKWNDSRILIELGTNNFTCNIDVTTPTMITVERNGTGSISFTGTNVSYGSEGVSILTNSQISMALIKIISATTKMIRISNKT